MSTNSKYQMVLETYSLILIVNNGHTDTITRLKMFWVITLQCQVMDGKLIHLLRWLNAVASEAEKDTKLEHSVAFVDELEDEVTDICCLLLQVKVLLLLISS
ncbi:unnamed protein product [Lathyrus sativus]|nr:unnamed protein product [Lathyrus sativus]